MTLFWKKIVTVWAYYWKWKNWWYEIDVNIKDIKLKAEWNEVIPYIIDYPFAFMTKKEAKNEWISKEEVEISFTNPNE